MFQKSTLLFGRWVYMQSLYFKVSVPLSQWVRNQSTLIVAEHNGENLLQNTRHAVTAAKKLGGDISCIVAGSKCAGPAAEVAKIEGISKVIVAENAAYEGFLPENLSPLLLAAQNQFKFSHIIGGSSAFTRSLLPRVAAKLDVSPVSDVIEIKVIISIYLAELEVKNFRRRKVVSSSWYYCYALLKCRCCALSNFVGFVCHINFFVILEA